MEERALTDIRDRLLPPELLSRFAATLQRELEEAARGANAERTRAQIELADPRDYILNLVACIEEDADAPHALIARLKTLEEQETALEQALVTVLERQVIRLPANYEAIYHRAVRSPTSTSISPRATRWPHARRSAR